MFIEFEKRLENSINSNYNYKKDTMLHNFIFWKICIEKPKTDFEKTIMKKLTACFYQTESEECGIEYLRGFRKIKKDH